MTSKPVMGEIEARLKDLQEQIIHYKGEAGKANREMVELTAILSHVPMFMMIVDRERRVKSVSHAILDFSGRTEEEVLGLRGGEALRCVHHLDDPRGCGFGLACDTCVVRRTVEDTLHNQRNHSKVECGLSFAGDSMDERSLLVSTAYVENPDVGALVFIEDITERKRAENEREELIQELRTALSEVKTLRGILPLCSYCKKIRDDRGYWEQVDVYLYSHSQADISHGVCPDCLKKYYPQVHGRSTGE